MTSLMVIFVLLLLVFLNRQASTNAAVARSISSELQQQLKAAGFEETRILPNDPYTLILEAPGDALVFARNKSKVGRQGEQFLAKEIPNLANVLCDEKFRGSVESLIVEGYPDAARAGGSANAAPNFNLKLAQDRSREVVRKSLLSLGGEQERACLAEKISASGHGSSSSPDAEAVTFRIHLNSGAAAEQLRRMAAERSAPAPPQSAISAILDGLQSRIGPLDFQLSETEFNRYLSHLLNTYPRPGVVSATVKLYAGNYVSVYAILDFDEIERRRPGTIPAELDQIPGGRHPVLLDVRFQAQDGTITYSVEKASFGKGTLPLPAARQLIQGLAAIQPEHFPADGPIALPFGLRHIETRKQLLLWHR